MRRLTLDQTWEQCLAMWKWISRQCLGKSEQWCCVNVVRLKLEWLSDRGIREDDLEEDCFFCEYEARYYSSDCRLCPARKVDLKFGCCREAYSYREHPRLFYAELKRLNKIRLSKQLTLSGHNLNRSIL